MKKHEYNGCSFEVPTLTKGFYFEVSKPAFPWESGISTYVSRWDVEKFNKPSPPRMIDTARNDGSRTVSFGRCEPNANCMYGDCSRGPCWC